MRVLQVVLMRLTPYLARRQTQYTTVCVAPEPTRNPAERHKYANERLFSKNSKKIGKKYMKVVTNGGLWCILNVSLGEVYPY